MENTDNTVENVTKDKKQINRRILLLGLAGAVGLIVVVTVIIYVVLGSSNKNDLSKTEAPIISTENLEASLTDLNVSAESADASTSSLKETLNSYNKQLKASE